MPSALSSAYKPLTAIESRAPNARLLVAMTFLLTIVGYQVAAPFISISGDESSLPAIVIRIITVLACAICLWLNPVGRQSTLWPLLPLYVFLFAYAFRLYDNFFLREFEWQADPAVAFGMIIGSAILPVALFSPIISRLEPNGLRRLSLPIAVCFLAGLALNWDHLTATATVSQASLDKLNPIALGGAAVSLALTLLLLPGRGRLSNAFRYLLIMVLLATVAFSQARGPIVAGAVALLALGLTSQGPYRGLLIRATLIGTIGFALVTLLTDINLIDIAFDRFSTDSATPLQHNSVWMRQQSWSAAWQQYLEHPAFGDRVFEPTLRTYPHNLFLESLISVGAFGTTVLLAYIFSCARATWGLLSSKRSDATDHLIAVLFMKEFIAVQFSFAIWGSPIFWFLSACLIGRYSVMQRRQVGDAPQFQAPRGSHASHHLYKTK